MTKPFLIFALSALFLVSGGSGSAALAQQHTTSPQVQKPFVDEATGATLRWMIRHNKKLAEISERANKIDMVWIGDSITHQWEYGGQEVWTEFYGHRNALNLGFGGDVTENVLWRLEHGEIDGINPKLAVVMIGTNNAGNRQASAPDKAEDTAAGVAAIVNELHTRLPNTRVLLLAIFPRGTTSDDPLRQRNNEVNELIANIGDREYVHFLDINDAFLDDAGRLSTQIMPDFLHLNKEGYKIWAEAIEPTVKRLIKGE